MALLFQPQDLCPALIVFLRFSKGSQPLFADIGRLTHRPLMRYHSISVGIVVIPWRICKALLRLLGKRPLHGNHLPAEVYDILRRHPFLPAAFVSAVTESIFPGRGVRVFCQIAEREASHLRRRFIGRFFEDFRIRLPGHLLS